MKVEKVEQNEKIILNSYDMEQILDIAEFRKRGINFSEGRTCYYILKYPIVHNGISYHSVKIKGCGFYSEGKDVILPGEKAFVRNEPHYGFDEYANAIEVYSDIAPFGGMVLSKAEREYKNFKILLENEVSTLLPVMLLKYKELSFNGERLGAVVSLCTERHPFRMYRLLWRSELISCEEENYYNQILRSEGIRGNISNFQDKIKLIQRLSVKYTSEIHKFSDAKLFIHSGGWSNIQYNLQSHNIVLVDLDSSREMNEEVIRFYDLYTKRDLVSNIYRLLISLYNPNVISQFDQQNLMETNFVYYLLEGYFPESPELRVREVADEIMKFYINRCFNNIKKIEYKMNSIDENEVKALELSMFEFYKFCLSKIVGLDVKQ